MKFDRKSLLLYAVTDRTWLNGRALEEQVEQAIRGGVTFLQLREKDLPANEFFTEALRMGEVARRWNVPFVINDNIEIALASGADGAHIGQGDGPVAKARAMLGDGRILGVSAQTVEQAVRAERDGADYLGVGAVFPTASKADADDVSVEELKAICESVSIPVIAIGGISARNALRLAGTGIAGIAVISALFSAPDIHEAAKELRALCREAAFG